MEENLTRQIKIYCPQHQTTFEVAEGPQIVCEIREHTLSNNFPHGEFWEYCCDCQTFFPSDLELGGKPADSCRQCERATIRRFVCDECKIIAFDSADETRGEIYEVHPTQGIKPHCPGCQKQFVDEKFHQHICSDIGTNLLTAREQCPFCKKNLTVKQLNQTEILETSETLPLALKTIRCPNCDSRNLKDTFFCGKCGQPFNNAVSTQVLSSSSLRPLMRDQVKTAVLPSSLSTVSVSGKPTISSYQPVIIGLVVIGIISTIAIFLAAQKNQSVSYDSSLSSNDISVKAAQDNSFSNGSNSSIGSTRRTPDPVQPANVRQEVSDALSRWKADAEALDFSSYMNNYADTVDYYSVGKSDRSRVSKDKQRAFRLYNTIQIKLNNIRITPNSEGNKATVIVDKSWNFKGAQKSTEGEVEQELKLAKINGRWYITGEKDLKVYAKSH